MLASKYALITGGASGLGYEFACLFARHKYNLILIGRDQKKLNEAKQKLETSFETNVQIIAKDLSNPHSSQEIFNHLEKEKINIDVLVNNAGFANFGLFNEIPSPNLLSEIDVNIRALTAMTRLFLPGMIGRRKGKILNLASTAAFQPGPLMAVYYASKSYVLSFSEALTEEIKGTGVTISVLCPGPTSTGFAKRAGIENTPIFTNHLSDPKVVARTGYKGLMKGKRVIIPGFTNKIYSVLVNFIPKSIIMKSVKKMQELR